ncbi:hypothetical protein HS088_TW15G00528 [Tripterygium wilfordii]|uniref:MADS-box domain-containing protein n=1 Tax=Tripterygium wilfordii TaxID=458696 RepID=A0A7J7CLU6_TRIWF|nr:agamous-like MADS-box protein AGL80 [Tripterygium wilfordii]KAF5735029.1 hypothetical protein HS088_TW15G00528 [Tripterygium wilfordii]
MVRKKVNLAHITDDATRKSTFRKRKNGLIKKISELSTLCGIQACLIIYSCWDSKPFVWPSIDGVNQALGRFKSMSEEEQAKRRMDQEGFIQQRIEKTERKLMKQCLANRELEMTNVMFKCLTGESSVQSLNKMVDLNDLAWVIKKNLKEIEKSLGSAL